MINTLFLVFISFMVFVPLGADLAVLIGYKHEHLSWWFHGFLVFLILLVAIVDGYLMTKEDKE